MSAKVKTLKDGTIELQVTEGGWRSEYVEVFSESGCTSIMLGAPGGPSIKEVGFLLDLPGLRSVRFLKGVEDCSAVEGVVGLRALSLAVDYRGPLSLSGLDDLRELSMPFISDVDGLAELSSLRYLHVWYWPKDFESFSVLGTKGELEFLRVEFRRTVQIVDSALGDVPNLKKLWLYSGRLLDSRGLGDAVGLHELALRATKIGELGFVRRLTDLRSLELENCGEVASLEPIRGHGRLEHVAIAERTVVSDGDLTPLLDLPAAHSVAIGRRADHYNVPLSDVRRP